MPDKGQYRLDERDQRNSTDDVFDGSGQSGVDLCRENLKNLDGDKRHNHDDDASDENAEHESSLKTQNPPGFLQRVRVKILLSHFA